MKSGLAPCWFTPGEHPDVGRRRSSSGSLKRPVGRLNEARWKGSPTIQTREEEVVAGHGLDRGLKSRRVVDTIGPNGDVYEDTYSEDMAAPDCSYWALLTESIDQIAVYAAKVLERYDLPRPGAHGYFWDDQNGKLAWGHERPPSASPSDLGFTGLWYDVRERFIDENISADPSCIEAGYASDYLDIYGSLEHERERNNSFDAGLHAGKELGRVQERWLLTIKFGQQLINEEIRRDRAAYARRVQNKNGAKLRNDKIIEAARNIVAARRSGRRDQLSATAMAKIVKRRADDGRAIETIAEVLRNRKAEWLPKSFTD